MNQILPGGGAPGSRIVGAGLMPQVAAQARAFQPSDIAGLILDLDADAGVTLNAANVSAWRDQSPTGANLVQGTAANQPKFVAGAVNGHAAIQPNDANDRLTDTAKPDLSGLAGYTFFRVFKATQTSTTAVGAEGSNATAAEAWQVSSNNLYAFVGGSAQVIFPFTDTASYHIGETLYDGTLAAANRLKVFHDGTMPTLTPSGTVPASCPNGAGYEVGHATASWTGFISRIVGYNRTLSAVERAQVGRYLAARYALATTY